MNQIDNKPNLMISELMEPIIRVIVYAIFGLFTLGQGLPAADQQQDNVIQKLENTAELQQAADDSKPEIPSVSDDSEEESKPGSRPSTPTEISSDSMDFDIESRQAVLSGNVLVEDERIKLKSDVMIVQFDEHDQLQMIELQGQVIITAADSEARSGKAVYDFDDAIITLSEDPELIQGLNRVVGAEKIIYSRETGKFKTQGGRPRVVFRKDDHEQKNLLDIFNQANEE